MPLLSVVVLVVDQFDVCLDASFFGTLGGAPSDHIGIDPEPRADLVEGVPRAALGNQVFGGIENGQGGLTAGSQRLIHPPRRGDDRIRVPVSGEQDRLVGGQINQRREASASGGSERDPLHHGPP